MGTIDPDIYLSETDFSMFFGSDLSICLGAVCTCVKTH